MSSDSAAMDKRNDTSFSRKRSATFGAYGSMDRSCEDQSRPESMGATLMDILDSPTSGHQPVPGTNQKETELFEIIEKLQGSRIDEQRCQFPLPLKSQLLTLGGALPLVLPSKAGGFWIDPPPERLPDLSPTSTNPGAELEHYDIMERDAEAKIYRDVFRSRYHHSFTAVDPCLGSLVQSVCLEEEENRLRVILRMKECSLHGVFSLSLFPNIPSTVELAKMLCEKVTVAKFDAVCYLKAPDLIQTFDEHRVSRNFKFGVLYQKDKQFTEEEILSNNDESDEYKEFLSILGETIQLQGFTGFRGGLDVCHGQTGCESIFTSFHGREIMFHVATKLPFTDCDPQQLQRKRHIGNDIVALVYQEGHTPFIPDVIKSHFLHCFVVIRRIASSDEGSGFAYQISVTARDDVPNFGPVLPDPPLFTDHSHLREFLLTKLINAEISCYKAEQFHRLELRTRTSLLQTLRTELYTRSQCMMGDPLSTQLPPAEGVRTSEGTGGFIENFKRAIRVRSHSFETLGVPRKTATSSQKHKTEKDSESDRSSASLSTNSDGTGPDIRDHPSPQEET
ncbi:unnamed protein product [Knipowitschia caucasica]|uniref:Rap-GAP domain-containing protein n=1 Tax=Knipowitschia caucasica TaxID=637954 RepID=A0AAV2MC57_KNICA